MEALQTKLTQRKCGAIVQRGARIGQQCGKPAGKDGICHNCRRRATLSRVNPLHLGRFEGNKPRRIKKEITNLQEGLVVRAVQDRKRIRMNKKPIVFNLIEENKSEKEKVRSTMNGETKTFPLNDDKLKEMATFDLMMMMMGKIESLTKSQRTFEENQRKLTDLYKRLSENSPTRNSSTATTKSND